MFSVANFGRTDMQIPRSLYERDAISSPTAWERNHCGEQ
jgi:hypothetical protein